MGAVHNFFLVLGFMTICNEPFGLDMWNTVHILVCNINMLRRELIIFYIVLSCRAVVIQRPRDGQIYEGRFLAAALETRSCRNRHERNNRRAVLSMWSVPRCYKQGDGSELSHFCTGVCEEKTWSRETEEFALLETVARERLMKTQQAAVVICELWRLTVALCWSQWLRGLRHEPSSPARMLGSSVRIPFESWMSVLCAFILCFCCSVCR
jgi:hypothetical protein